MKLAVHPDSLFFRQNGSSAPGPQQVSVTATGGKLAGFTAVAATASGGNWLTVSPASGTGPGNITVSVSTNGLAAGEYAGSIAITGTGVSNGPVKIPVSLEINEAGSDDHGKPTGKPAPALIVRPSDLEFNAVAGGSAPKPAQVEIINPGGADLAWTAAVAISSPPGGNWLAISPSSGTGKGVVQVSVDPSKLSQPGTYKGQINFIGGSSKATVNVKLDLDAPRGPKLVIDPRAFNFIVNDATQKPAFQTLRVSNAGGGSFTWTATATVSSPSGGKWLSISPSGGSGNASVTVKADPTGLQPGMYAGSITVKAGADSADAKVFLWVLGPSKPRVTVTPKSVTFAVAGGVASPASRTIKIDSSSTGLSFTATAAVAAPKGGNWLTITPAAGAVPGSVSASVTPGTLAPGIYTGTITIKVPGAAQESFTVYVGMKVFAASEAPHFEVEPGGLAFTAVKGGANPTPATVSLVVDGATSVAWTAAATSSGGTTNWLSVNPTQGTATAAGPNHVTVSASISGLAAGVYSGSVVFTPATASNAPPVTLHVKLIVSDTRATGKDMWPAMMAATTPVQLTALVKGPADGFITQADFPINISVFVADTTGAPVSGAAVMVSSSNGEPDLLLDDLGGGNYAGTFRPLTSGPVTLTGSAQTDTQVSDTFAVMGDIEAAAGTPSLVFQGGVVSAASFAQSPAPLAAGSLMSLFGRAIAGAGGSATGIIPLPTSLAGVSVTIGGVPAPLIAAIPAASSSGYDQINLQVPFELAGLAQADVVVNNNGVVGVPETISIGAAPALFTTTQNGDGPGAFRHTDGSPVDSLRAVAVGESLQLYGTGLGAVLSPVATGAAAVGANQVAGNVTVTIGGQPARVQYAGLAPGWVGLYQINVVVPNGTAGDNVPVIVLVDGTPATGRAVIPTIR